MSSGAGENKQNESEGTQTANESKQESKPNTPGTETKSETSTDTNASKESLKEIDEAKASVINRFKSFAPDIQSELYLKSVEERASLQKKLAEIESAKIAEEKQKRKAIEDELLPHMERFGMDKSSLTNSTGAEFDRIVQSVRVSIKIDEKNKELEKKISEMEKTSLKRPESTLDMPPAKNRRSEIDHYDKELSQSLSIKSLPGHSDRDFSKVNTESKNPEKKSEIDVKDTFKGRFSNLQKDDIFQLSFQDLEKLYKNETALISDFVTKGAKVESVLSTGIRKFENDAIRTSESSKEYKRLTDE